MPPPPASHEQASVPSRSEAPIDDVRDRYARRGEPTAADRASARAFIDGKIEMLRRDPHMSEAQKAAAIAELEAQKRQVE
ncbi:MAG TPA: hypothetical protein DCW29_17550 [Janthinobacterium sp.]|nr:hypothetical protein [Janthinobacterium sp.]